MKAGVIGLGAMGEGMARNVAKAGFLTGVYNRTVARRKVWPKSSMSKPSISRKTLPQASILC